MNHLYPSTGQSVLDYLLEKRMKAQSQMRTHAHVKKFSQQMRAVLLIFNADPFLMEAVAPYVNFETESIYWNNILRLPLSSGQKTAVRWAYGVWTDEQPKGNCFGGALSLSAHYQVAILEALCLRWGLRG